MTETSAWYVNIYLIAAAILFTIGLVSLLLHRNLIKKAVSLGIMDSSVYLLLVSVGYVSGKAAPVVENTEAAVSYAVYANPIPTGLVLTGIVVSVSVTAFLLALTVKLYRIYHTLDLDEILAAAKKGDN